MWLLTTTVAWSAPYQGVGAASVDPAVVAKYAPAPLDPDVARRVELAMDVRAAGAGPLTPDGGKMVFTWAITGSSQVWRLDGPRAFPVQLTGGAETTSVVALTRDGTHAIVSRDHGGTENYGIYLLPIDGGPLVPIFADPAHRAFVHEVGTDGRSIWFVANDRAPDSTAVYRYDLVTRATELVVGDPGLWSVRDERDGKLLLTKDTGAQSNEVWEYDPVKKKKVALLGVGERQKYDVQYGRTPDEVLVVTNATAESSASGLRSSDLRRLYRWTKRKGLEPLGPVVAQEMTRATLDEPAQRLIVHYSDRGRTHPVVYDATTLAEIPLPPIPADALQVTLEPATRDDRFATLRVTVAGSPAVTSVYEWATGKLVPWTVPSFPEVDPKSFAVPKLDAFPARDGTPIPYVVRVPAACERPATPCPVLVEFHGGPEGQAVPNFNPRDQLFVDAGFVLVQPNIRGSSGYGRAWLEADDREKRETAIDDIEDAGKFVRQRFTVNGVAPKVGVFGGSYGGYATLIAMTRLAGTYDAGVSTVGPANLVSHLTNTAPYRRAVRITEYGDPVKDQALLMQLSPITYVNRAKGPILLLQGVDDPRVPVGEAVAMHEALVAGGRPSQLYLFAGEGHGAARRDARVLMTGHVLQFFEAQLNPAPAAAADAPKP
jgi:protease II